nr:SH3 domain-containing protein [Clostridia bacterium]
MRKFLALLTTISLLFLTPFAMGESPPDATPLPGYTLHASPEEILVFATRSLKGNLVGTLISDEDQNVQVLSVTGEWCYISFTTTDGTRHGYVPLSRFDVAPQATPAPQPLVSIPAGTTAWVMNVDSGYRLNLRQEPRDLAKSEGKYYTGTPVTLTGKSESGFAQVLLAGTVLGWMDLRYLTTDAEAFVPEMPVVTVKGNGAAIRSGPGTDYPRLARYASGTQVTVLGVRSDGWYHVQVEDLVGYMNDTLLSGHFPFGYGMDSDNPSLSNSDTDHSSVFYINTRAADSQLHLRKSASASSKSMGLFYTGTPLTVISYTRTGWAYVRIGQTEGYMAADYFTEVQPQQYGDVRFIRNNHATGLNLRDTPSTGGALLGFVPNNGQVTLLGELSNGWCYVDYNGTLGYMLNIENLKTK